MLSVGDAAALADRFAVGADARLSGPVARGEQGQIWRLTTSQGAWAVKEPFEPPPPDEAEEAAAFQEAALAAGVPSPTVVRTTDGEVFAGVGSAAVRLFGWVELRQRSAMIDPVTVGRIVAAVHQVPYEGRLPLDEWYTDPIGADRWDQLVALVTEAGAPFAADLAGYRDDLVRLETLMEAPADLRTCHRDLFADNILRTEAGGLCVIDWENCGLADPSQELGVVAFDFGAGDPDRITALLAAYTAAGGPGRLDRPSRCSMVIAQLGHIGERCCRRWLQARTDAERARAMAGVEEFIGPSRLTPGGVEQMVTAAAAARPRSGTSRDP
jgi:aminoglycoside phosphotransferase (APT) family kinase protein